MGFMLSSRGSDAWEELPPSLFEKPIRTRASKPILGPDQLLEVTESRERPAVLVVWPCALPNRAGVCKNLGKSHSKVVAVPFSRYRHSSRPVSSPNARQT